MNQSQSVTSAAHWFGEHRPDIHNMAFRHRKADETPLIIALSLTVLVVAALIWCCITPILRARAKRSGFSDHDLEAAVANGPPFANLNALHDPSSGQYSKFLGSTYNRTRSMTLPRAVYDPFQHRASLAHHGTGTSQRSYYMYIGRQRSRSLSSLPCLPPLYCPDPESSLTIEHELPPPPEYSSPPGSPSNPTPTHAPTSPNSDMVAPLPEVNGTDHETTFSGHNNTSIGARPPFEPGEWKDLPLSLSQPTIREISNTLNRTLSSPGRYTANHDISKSALHTPGNDPFYGAYTVFVDQFGGRLSIPDQITPTSDSIVTISPCDTVSTAGNLTDTQLIPDKVDDRTYNDSYEAIAPLASEYFFETVEIP